jgi:hypothetical protein
LDADAMRRFEADWRTTGKKLDMGKSCVRFKKLVDVPLDVIGRTLAEVTVERFLAAYVPHIPPAAKKRK